MKETLFGFKFRALGGENELQLYAASQAAAELLSSRAIALVEEIERKFSRYRPESIVSIINNSAGAAAVAVDQETAGLLNYAQTLYQQSDGLFDITSGILRQAWDFKAGVVPSQRELDALLPLIGFDKIEWRDPLVRLKHAGMQIDFGGIGKEFAVDRVSALLLEAGVVSGLVNFAGDVRVLGPHPDGSPWKIGIANPRSPQQALLHAEIAAGALATSGDYERYFEVAGRRYCHILNPKTGWPVEELRSVSVIAELCTVAGSACTTAMLLGEGRGRKFLDDLGVTYVLIDKRGELYSSATFPAQRQAAQHSR